MDKELIFFLEYIFVKMGGPFTRAVFGSKKHFSEQDVDEIDQLTTVRERLGKNERCLHIIIYYKGSSPPNYSFSSEAGS